MSILLGRGFMRGKLPDFFSYSNGGGESTARINFSNSDEEQIMTGIKIVADVLEEIRITPQ